MHAEDEEVALLAAEVVFQLCVPTAPFATSVQDEGVESVEVSVFMPFLLSLLKVVCHSSQQLSRERRWHCSEDSPCRISACWTI